MPMFNQKTAGLLSGGMQGKTPEKKQQRKRSSDSRKVKGRIRDV